MIAAYMPLPRWAWAIGEGRQSADHETLDRAKAMVPERYDDGFVPANDAALRYGLALNDAGFFWEAHEVLEAVWKAAPQGGRDRILLRACIQVANANLKRKLNRPSAMRKLLNEVLADLIELEARVPTGPATSFAAQFDRRTLRAAITEQCERAGEILGSSTPQYEIKYTLLAS